MPTTRRFDFVWILFVLAVAAAAPVSVAHAQGGLSIPMHGNWCGPNHPSNPVEASFQPIDPLDEACRQHDLCVAARGYGSCGCDIGFMETLRRMVYPNPMIEEKARAIYDAIGLMPCADPIGSAQKQERVWGEMVDDVVSGRCAPWDMPMRLAKLGMTVMETKLRRGW